MVKVTVVQGCDWPVEVDTMDYDYQPLCSYCNDQGCENCDIDIHRRWCDDPDCECVEERR